MSNYDYLGLKRSPDQLDYKNTIRQRDNYTCQLCGQPGHDVDHIIPWDISHDSSPSNLRVLCHRCNCMTRRQRCDAALPLDDWYTMIECELAWVDKVGVSCPKRRERLQRHCLAECTRVAPLSVVKEGRGVRSAPPGVGIGWCLSEFYTPNIHYTTSSLQTPLNRLISLTELTRRETMKAVVCPVCEGKGMVYVGSFAPGSTVTQPPYQTCHGCDGKGYIIIPEETPDTYCIRPENT